MLSKARIEEELKAALKAGDALRLSVLRLLLTSLHNLEIDKQAELTKEDIVAVVQREAKRRREAIESYRAAGQAERQGQEERELALLEAYLPEQLSDEELERIVREIVAANPELPEGALIGKAMQVLKGKADGSRVAQMVKAKREDG